MMNFTRMEKDYTHKIFTISLNVFSCIFNFFVIDFSRIILNLKSIKLCRKKKYKYKKIKINPR